MPTSEKEFSKGLIKSCSNSISARRFFMKRLVVILAFLFVPSLAFSFPFRAVEPGEKIPSVKLKKIDGTSFSLSSATVKGKGLILLFWGADSEGKKKRAMEVMEILDEVGRGHREIGVLAINAQKDTPEVINEVVSRISAEYPVLLDEKHEAYKAFGVFVMPSILVVDGNGKIKTGFGYSNTIGERLETEALVLLGEISEQNGKKRLMFEVSGKSEQERKAMRYLELGKRMENKGMSRKAKDEYTRAVELFDLPEAHTMLGLLLLEEGDLEEAEKEIKKGFDADPNSIQGKIAYARLRVAKGELEGVVEELQGLSFRSPKNYAVHYALGQAYEAKGDLKDAVREYKKAFEFLRKGTLKR
jgi:peroxiredoxin/predicted negative regulator of RcsB-dependent stress response